MKRLIVSVLWILAAAPTWADMDRAALLGLSASVLKIEAQRVQGGFSLGSGVVIAPETVVTNCHVTRDALKINVLRGGVRWLAAAQLSDVDHDLCLLRVPSLQAPVVSLGRADELRRGQPVTALGYTGGMGMQNSPGEVIALHRLDGSRVIRSSNWFSSGASGGGLFDEDLRLVGILTFRLRGGEAHYFAAPVEWLQPMLAATGQDGYSDVAPDRSKRLAYWQRPVSAQPNFLQAALLQRDDRWPELESLTAAWARADATDPEPWYLMGMALERMDRLPEADRALACSLAIEPDAAAASGRLALSDDRAGPTAHVAPVESRLRHPNHPPPERAASPPIDTDATCAMGAGLPQTP
jgi:serine protease Do